MPTAASLIAKAGTNKYLHKALTSWPDYARLVALRTKVAQHQRTLSPVPQVSPPADEGADIDAWLTDVARAANAQRDAEVQRGALADLLRDIDAGITAVCEVHTEVLLKSLAADLDELMRDVEDVVSRLDGATTPASAIASGTADAWRDLTPLREQYDDLRDAQHVLMSTADHVILSSAVSPYLDDELASDLVLANLDKLVPGWRQPPPTHITMSGPPPDRRPWPVEPVEKLVWLVASDAKPWVPTLHELYRLQERRRAKDNPPAPARPEGRGDDTLLNKPLPTAVVAEAV